MGALRNTVAHAVLGASVVVFARAAILVRGRKVLGTVEPTAQLTVVVLRAFSDETNSSSEPSIWQAEMQVSESGMLESHALPV